MEKLTKRQRQVFDFIVRFHELHGYPPTIREIQHDFGLRSTKGVKDHIDRLVEKGYLRRTDGSARAIEIVGNRQATSASIPVVGRVAAGQPLLATENILGHIAVPGTLVRGEGCFLLAVEGDSMKGAGILNHDYVLVRPQPFVEQGEIAVVLVDDEATVKRFFRREGVIELHPENPDFDVLRYGPDSNALRVVGKVVAVIRSLDTDLL